jgi:Uma2 family endonuclease
MGAGSLATADLVVEILSPSTAHYDRTTKADTYAALGVRELWLVDVERRTIEQRVLVDGGWCVEGVHSGATVVHAASFPELAVALADVFA